MFYQNTAPRPTLFFDSSIWTHEIRKSSILFSTTDSSMGWYKNHLTENEMIYTQFLPSSSLLPPPPPMPEHQKSLTASAKLLVDLHNFPFIRIVRRLT